MTQRTYHSQSRFDDTRSPIMIVFLVLPLFLMALDDHVRKEIQDTADENTHDPICRIMHRDSSVMGSAKYNTATQHTLGGGPTTRKTPPGNMPGPFLANSIISSFYRKRCA